MKLQDLSAFQLNLLKSDWGRTLRERGTKGLFYNFPLRNFAHTPSYTQITFFGEQNVFERAVGGHGPARKIRAIRLDES